MNNDIEKLSVAIIGSGNVASHLVMALEGKTSVCMVNPHTLDNFPEKCDIALIAVKDSAVPEVAGKINGRAGITAHTAGSIPMSQLSGCGGKYGVFYPLQTFTKGVSLDYSDIPFFIEASDEDTLSRLKDLAGMISDTVIPADSEARKYLHLASVFACNFTNALMGISQDILSEVGIDFKVMLPLLRQTISKLDTLSPGEAQTGPAVREDWPVMQAHLEMLSGHKNIQKIYRDISYEIIDKKHKSL